MRVLKWIADRVHGRVGAAQTAVGLVPHKPDLDLAGLDITAARLDEALAVKPDEWAAELRLQEEFFDRINADLPRELEVQRETLAARSSSEQKVTLSKVPSATQVVESQ
jgi:phosphoenolpyruvate carboxykinase (GTP)